MKEGHLPVMAEEVMRFSPRVPAASRSTPPSAEPGTPSGSWRRTAPDGRLLGLDADGAAIARVRARLARFGDRARAAPGQLPRARRRRPGGRLRRGGRPACFDLGLSSYQLADVERGFGFRAGGPLDMRFDTEPRAYPPPSCWRPSTPRELTALFRRYGEEPFAGRIARAIVEARRRRPRSRRPSELAALVERVAPPAPRGRRRIHPATRVFQALRIAVNDELGALEAGAGRGRRAAPARRPARRPELPLARGPDRQALHRRRAARLRLPARGARSASAAGSLASRLVAGPRSRPARARSPPTPGRAAPDSRAAERIAA